MRVVAVIIVHQRDVKAEFMNTALGIALVTAPLCGVALTRIAWTWPVRERSLPYFPHRAQFAFFVNAASSVALLAAIKSNTKPSLKLMPALEPGSDRRQSGIARNKNNHMLRSDLLLGLAAARYGCRRSPARAFAQTANAGRHPDRPAPSLLLARLARVADAASQDVPFPGLDVISGWSAKGPIDAMDKAASPPRCSRRRRPEYGSGTRRDAATWRAA